MNRITTIFFVFMTLFIVSCNKNKDNYSCTITYPQDGDEFFEDENIQVCVKTNDNGSNTVLLFIDDKCYTGSSDFPYGFTIQAGDLLPGTHTIRAEAQNNEGKRSQASVSILVKPAEYESPDSVSFSDGKLPAGWETNGWFMDPTNGYDDSFSLFTRADNATVTALKTCSSIEFYLRGGCGDIYFYMDDILIEIIGIGNWNPNRCSPQGWKKYEYSFPENLHTFIWKSFSDPGSNYFAGLDAIRFSK